MDQTGTLLCFVMIGQKVNRGQCLEAGMWGAWEGQANLGNRGKTLGLGQSRLSDTNTKDGGCVQLHLGPQNTMGKLVHHFAWICLYLYTVSSL